MPKIDYSNTWTARILNKDSPHRPTPQEIARFWRDVRLTRNGRCTSKFGGHIDKNGYGIFSVYRQGKWRRLRAHRMAYFLYKGRIDPNLTIDHLCRERDCITESDLEEKSRTANIFATPFSTASINKAKTHCINEHPLSGDNLRIGTGGKRICIKCDSDYKLHYNRAYYEVKKPRGKYKPRKGKNNAIK